MMFEQLAEEGVAGSRGQVWMVKVWEVVELLVVGAESGIHCIALVEVGSLVDC